jgi:putative ABC transport system permease protein
MLAYYLRLALRSFRRNPGLTALMVMAIALGIAVCVMTLTVYHAMSGNPIWWKNDRLYAVTMDSWDANQGFTRSNAETHMPPPLMTYRDATSLMRADIPQRKAVMFEASGVVSGAGPVAVRIDTRFTSADFFAMFDVPFLYGGSWSRAADDPPQPLIVLSRELNERLFAGANSVGRTLRWNDHEFRVAGVLDYWFPRPRFYDVTSGSFSPPEDAYVPFAWGRAPDLRSAGNIDCWKPEPIDTSEQFFSSECVWVQMWLELPDRASRERMQAYIDNYWAEQHKGGRFARPRDNRLSNVGQWLHDQHVVDNDNRVLVGLAFAFLAVCLINTVGLLLAKFLNAAAITGVRRALGASQRQVFTQHLVEVALIAGSGALLGLGLAALGLAAVHHMYAAAHLGKPGGYQELTHFDRVGVLWAIALAIVATLLAGLYPAWRVGRMPPAVYLKSQ